MSYPTWSDLSSPSIVPPLGGRQPQRIGGAAVMVSTAPDLRLIENAAGPSDRQPFFNSTLMVQDHGGVAIAGPYIGAPYSVMILESLIAQGAKQVVVLGWCGALDQDLLVGDLLIPSVAHCDEGTSRHYAALDPALPVTRPDPALSARLGDFIQGQGQDVSFSPVWTTDAIYRETAGKKDWFRQRGALAVEMECSALFGAAAFRKVPITALLVVSDSLADPGGNWDPGFKKKRFKTMRRTACELVLKFARTLAHDT